MPNRADRVEVEYCPTAEDRAAWLLHWWEKSIARASRSLLSWLIRLMRGIVLCFIAVLLAAIVFLMVMEVLGTHPLKKDFSPILSGIAVLLILMAALAWGVGPKSFARRLTRRAALRQFRLLAKQTPERNQKAILTPEKAIEIVYQNQVKIHSPVRGKQETILDWVCIASIDLAPQHVFFITENNLALIVPRRAFAHERAFLDFVETAWAFHRRGKEGSSASFAPPEGGRPEDRIIIHSDDRIAP